MEYQTGEQYQRCVLSKLQTLWNLSILYD